MSNVPTNLEPVREWVVFRSLPDENAARALAGQLQSADCPAEVSARALGSGVETEYCVFVPKSLEHRARWIVAQLPISDEELDFLATGKLPTPPGDTE
jgi:hypothetical protein